MPALPARDTAFSAGRDAVWGMDVFGVGDMELSGNRSADRSRAQKRAGGNEWLAMRFRRALARARRDADLAKLRQPPHTTTSLSEIVAVFPR